jgi:hypothetical protein
MTDVYDEANYLRLSKESSVHKLKAMKHACFSDEGVEERAQWLAAAQLEVEAIGCVPTAQRRYEEAIALFYAAGETARAKELEAHLSPDQLILFRERMADKKREHLNARRRERRAEKQR